MATIAIGGSSTKVISASCQLVMKSSAEAAISEAPYCVMKTSP